MEIRKLDIEEEEYHYKEEAITVPSVNVVLSTETNLASENPLTITHIPEGKPVNKDAKKQNKKPKYYGALPNSSRIIEAIGANQKLGITSFQNVFNTLHDVNLTLDPEIPQMTVNRRQSNVQGVIESIRKYYPKKLKNAPDVMRKMEKSEDNLDLFDDNEIIDNQISSDIEKVNEFTPVTLVKEDAGKKKKVDTKKKRPVKSKKKIAKKKVSNQSPQKEPTPALIMLQEEPIPIMISENTTPASNSQIELSEFPEIAFEHTSIILEPESVSQEPAIQKEFLRDLEEKTELFSPEFESKESLTEDKGIEETAPSISSASSVEPSHSNESVADILEISRKNNKDNEIEKQETKKEPLTEKLIVAPERIKPNVTQKIVNIGFENHLEGVKQIPEKKLKKQHKFEHSATESANIKESGKDILVTNKKNNNVNGSSKMSRKNDVWNILKRGPKESVPKALEPFFDFIDSEKKNVVRNLTLLDFANRKNCEFFRRHVNTYYWRRCNRD